MNQKDMRIKWQRFKAWLKKQFLAEYPDETSSIGRGQ